MNQATMSQPAIVRARLSELMHETTLARIGLAVIAVHVLDDNFLQPQPGTSAADHLVSGLFLLAVLLGVAAIYPKLRAGLRALLGVTLRASTPAGSRPDRKSTSDGSSASSTLHSCRQPADEQGGGSRT